MRILPEIQRTLLGHRCNVHGEGGSQNDEIRHARRLLLNPLPRMGEEAIVSLRELHP